MKIRCDRHALAAIALTASLVAGCGGGSSTGAPTVNADVTVHALDALRFDKSVYNAKSGNLTIAYVEDSSITHTLLIKDTPGFKLQVSSRGEAKTSNVTLTPGTYTIYCDIPGHEAAGMKATLNVS